MNHSDSEDMLPDTSEFTGKKFIRTAYMEFLKDFRDYLAEYIRDSVVELTVSEFAVSRPVKIFDGYTRGKARIKNQGAVSCYLSTTGQGGYRLDPGETIEFFVNNQLIVTTVSGSTTIGFIQS